MSEELRYIRTRYLHQRFPWEHIHWISTSHLSSLGKHQREFSNLYSKYLHSFVFILSLVCLPFPWRWCRNRLFDITSSLLVLQFDPSLAKSFFRIVEAFRVECWKLFNCPYCSSLSIFIVLACRIARAISELSCRLFTSSDFCSVHRKSPLQPSSAKHYSPASVDFPFLLLLLHTSWPYDKIRWQDDDGVQLVKLSKLHLNCWWCCENVECDWTVGQLQL